MDRHLARRLVDAFAGMSFDDGLTVTEATVVGLPATPVMLIHFRDEREPVRMLAAWWDFHGMAEMMDDPESLAGFAKAWPWRGSRLDRPAAILATVPRRDAATSPQTKWRRPLPTR